jgi:hypothetical protein
MATIAFIGVDKATIFTYRRVHTAVNMGRCLSKVACADYYINVSDLTIEDDLGSS